jgi:exodeoxyribonuclease VII small subunit
MSETSDPGAVQTFEATLEELEALVARMESGELGLEESLAAVERGMEQTPPGQVGRKNAEQKVQQHTQTGVNAPHEPHQRG